MSDDAFETECEFKVPSMMRVPVSIALSLKIVDRLNGGQGFGANNNSCPKYVGYHEDSFTALKRLVERINVCFSFTSLLKFSRHSKISTGSVSR